MTDAFLRTMQRIITLAVLLTAVGACSPVVRFTTRTDQPRAIEPKKGMALVVFMNTGQLGAGTAFYVLDADRRFLGETVGFSRLLIDVPAGRHEFYAVNKKDGSKISADLRADRTYFVRVRVGFGGGVELVAFTERREEWIHRQTWLETKTSEVNSDVIAGQAFVDKYYRWVDRNMARADEKLAAMPADTRQKTAILLPDDGI